jgi:hypothetical protein
MGHHPAALKAGLLKAGILRPRPSEELLSGALRVAGMMPPHRAAALSFFKPIAELEEPWRPVGTPELGKAWYGPFIHDVADTDADARNVGEMAHRLGVMHCEIGQTIADGVLHIKREFAAHYGVPLPEDEDSTLHPLRLRIRVGRSKDFILVEPEA